MSAYILMRILESAPSRYDRGIRILTLGKIDKIYDHLVLRIARGQQVLDLGSGTGALALRAAQRGATVRGIEINPQMLVIARRRASELSLEQNVDFNEMGIAELDREKAESYNAVMSGLCFSELTEDELTYTLSQVVKILKPGGLLLVADEVVPANTSIRIINWLARLPLLVITYVATQTTSHAVRDLPQKVKAAGLSIEELRLNRMGDFIELVAAKSERGQSESA
jgi:ubiquinone/menaquinone biosynthesis C-methylase UbiE